MPRVDFFALRVKMKRALTKTQIKYEKFEKSIDIAIKVC